MHISGMHERICLGIKIVKLKITDMKNVFLNFFLSNEALDFSEFLFGILQK